MATPSDKYMHLAPNVRQLLAASQRVVDLWGGDIDEIDSAVANLKKSLGNFALGDTRQPHRQDLRQKGPI